MKVALNNLSKGLLIILQKMLFKEVDFISPPITLFFQKQRGHTSIFSGILTIIAFIICITAAVYFSLDLIMKTNPSAYFYNKFINDTGEFPLNSSSMFHYVQFDGMFEVIPLDIQAVQVVSFMGENAMYLIDYDIKKYDHWIYDLCKDSDLKGIEYLKPDKFKENGCISKFYNATTGQTISTTEANFSYPKIEKGTSHPNNTFYVAIIQKCINSTINSLPCYDNQKINSYIDQLYGFSLYLIDQNIDITNYNEPFIKSFFKVSNGISDNTYTNNHLNFNPSNLVTHDGIVIDHTESILSYGYDQNEKIISEAGSSGILCTFYFWMQNRMQFYERSYKRCQDVLASIGGSINFIIVFVSYINFLYHQFIILKDSCMIIEQITENIPFKGANAFKRFDIDKQNMSLSALNNNFLQTVGATGKTPKNPNITNCTNQPLSISLKKTLSTVSTIPNYNVGFWQFICKCCLNNKNKANSLQKYIQFNQNFRTKLISEEHLFKNHFIAHQLKSSILFKENDKSGNLTILELYDSI